MNFKKLLLVFLALALCLGIVILLQGREQDSEEIFFGGAKDGKTALVDPASLPDPLATEEPVDDGIVWPDLTIDEMLEAENRQYAVVNDKNLLSAAFQPTSVPTANATPGDLATSYTPVRARAPSSPALMSSFATPASLPARITTSPAATSSIGV